MGGGRRGALGCAVLAIGLFGGAPSAAGAECPNAVIRSEGASGALPDCRAWEMVSPPQMNGGEVGGFDQNLGGEVLQAAANGEAVTFSSTAAFGEAQGAPPASQYIARRSPTGWQSENIAAPTLSGAYEGTTGVPYQLFSADLARGLMAEGRRCGAGEECPRAYSLRSGEGALLALSPAEPDLRFVGASPDLRHVVLASCAALTPQALEVPSGGGGCDPNEANLYEWQWGEGALRLLNLAPGQSQSTPGAALAAQGGAVSADGSRVYFTEEGNLYLREGSATEQVDEEVGGGGQFQSASADGAFAFFTKGGHLYRYNAQAEDPPFAIDLTPTGEVLGVLGGAQDGSVVYYQSDSGLYLWAEGAATEIAPGPSAAAPSDFPPATATARVSPEGSHLAFLSRESLSGYDNTDQGTGEADSEVFLYDAQSAQLSCASCNPTGQRPQGPSSIPGAIANGATHSYKPRELSTAGTRLFFDSRDTLLASDAGPAQDVYEWEAGGEGSCQHPGGCLSLISGGQSGADSSFVDASAGGDDAFFLSADGLLGAGAGATDLYDARVDGGYPRPQAPTPCEGDACQALPSPPEDPTPATLFPGPGDPAVGFARGHRGHHRHHRRHGGRLR